MNNIKNLAAFLLVFALLHLGAAPGFAGNEGRVGTAGALELLIPVGSRGTALSGSMNAMITGAEAIHWNPAGMARTSGVEAMFSNLRYIADIDLNYFAVSANFEDIGAFGLSLRSLSFGDIPITTVANPEGTGGTYSPRYITGGLTFSRAFTDRILGGFTFKFISERIERTSASGVALDFGVQYLSEVGLKLGVALKNLGPSISYDGPDLEFFAPVTGQEPGSRPRAVRLAGAEFELPSTLEIGIGYDYRVTEEHVVSVMGTFQNANLGSDEYRAGLEYAFSDQFFLRGGYMMLGTNDDENIYGATFGAGVVLPLETTSITFDYAYRVTDFFDGSQWFTFKIGF
jgi:hypothetical protein